MNLMDELGSRALKLGIPLSAHLDLTYRCNERCVHCYLDHDDHGEMTTAEIKGVLDQMAEAGVMFLVMSGGEVFMRRDFFELLEYARSLLFSIKIKTNAVMIGDKEADRLARAGIEGVQVSVYSARHDVHDEITKLPGSLKRTIEGMRRLRERGVKVIFANVLMQRNYADYPGVKALAVELGAEYTIDPTITPMMDGDRSILQLGLRAQELEEVFRNSELVGDVAEFCAPPQEVGDDILDGLPCSAGHNACYISPYGEVFPCVQFPLPSGNLRQQKFIDIWRDSPQLQEVRAITARQLPTCSTCSHVGTCSRCPGLAYQEGNMRGPSTQDCEKSYLRTGVVTAGMLARKPSGAAVSALVQIRGVNMAGLQHA